MPAFADHPDRPGARIWRRSGGGAILSGAVALLCLIGAAMMGWLAIGVLWAEGSPAGALAVLLCALAMLALAHYVRRDQQGKTGGTIILTRDGIELDLSRNRSLAHRSPACRMRLAWPDIASLDHRLEGYGAQGLGMMQRSYWLVPRTGAPVLLFEDRGIGSAQETESMMPLAQEIARHGRLGLIEHGMARGRGGILGAWFARGPELGAAELSPQEQARMWRRVWLTGSLASLALLAVMLGALLS